jgi:hypothetical protein
VDNGIPQLGYWLVSGCVASSSFLSEIDDGGDRADPNNRCHAVSAQSLTAASVARIFPVDHRRDRRPSPATLITQIFSLK